MGERLGLALTACSRAPTSALADVPPSAYAAIKPYSIPWWTHLTSGRALGPPCSQPALVCGRRRRAVRARSGPSGRSRRERRRNRCDPVDGFGVTTDHQAEPARSPTPPLVPESDVSGCPARRAGRLCRRRRGNPTICRRRSRVPGLPKRANCDRLIESARTSPDVRGATSDSTTGAGSVPPAIPSPTRASPTVASRLSRADAGSKTRTVEPATMLAPIRPSPTMPSWHGGWGDQGRGNCDPSY